MTITKYYIIDCVYHTVIPPEGHTYSQSFGYKYMRQASLQREHYPDPGRQDGLSSFAA